MHLPWHAGMAGCRTTQSPLELHEAKADALVGGIYATRLLPARVDSDRVHAHGRSGPQGTAGYLRQLRAGSLDNHVHAGGWRQGHIPPPSRGRRGEFRRRPPGPSRPRQLSVWVQSRFSCAAHVRYITRGYPSVSRACARLAASRPFQSLSPRAVPARSSRLTQDSLALPKASAHHVFVELLPVAASIFELVFTGRFTR